MKIVFTQIFYLLKIKQFVRLYNFQLFVIFYSLYFTKTYIVCVLKNEMTQK
jgi:hypothetical protein